MSSSTPPRPANRLADATSPYLLQHAHNPVDWYPWSEEALGRARDEDRLILLSVGYSSCHWCHVMERESFEDESIAAVMNEHFVNIKVDREERPDIDDIYMAATLAMNQGQGGWPMTVFLTPDLEPVFTGTYFPPDDAYGRPGFRTVLREIAGAWQQDPARLKEGATRFAEELRARRDRVSPLTVGEAEIRRAVQQYADEFDEAHGGFGGAPKFPPSTGLALLLRAHRRFDDARALTMVTKTLDAMASGGIYDHVGGGFARYATDREWLVPHFEKMLYDNALLTDAYLEAFQVTGDANYERVVRETLQYVQREMTAPEGGFYSATDADSEGEEGKYYVWTPEEIGEILDADDAKIFNAYFDITPRGNWEGKSIPRTRRALADVAKQFDLDAGALRDRVEAARAKVYAARRQRVAPGLDDKILTAWNGMMIRAFASAHRVLGDRTYLESAERAATFVLETLMDDSGRLLRTYRAGRAHLHAYLEDYAYLGEALVDLYETSGRRRWLDAAARLLERLIADFLDAGSGAFYHTAHDHEQLLLRYRDGTDGATPAANAVAAAALARASYHLDRPDFRAAAVGAVRAYGAMMSQYPRAFAKSLIVVDFLLEGPVEVAIVGTRDARDTEALRREVGRRFLPNRIQAESDPGAGEDTSDLPLLSGKALVDDRAALYVCRNFACAAPVTAPAEAASLLAEARGDAGLTTIAGRTSGSATAEGTARYAARSGGAGYRRLGRTDLTVSAVGFGTYRTTVGHGEHQEALTRAVQAGVNLIDTSTNYMDGGAERLIGTVLRGLWDGGDVQRDEIVLISKIGYVQGEVYEEAARRQEAGRGYPEVVRVQEGLWHCIHPEFLEDQLSRSLDRLEVDTLDVCLLHNPEYFLAHARSRGEALARARDAFYQRIETAFRFFEEQVEAGRIHAYGVSSNTLGAPPTDETAVSASRLVDAARRAGGEGHHMYVLQLPLNLFEAGPVLTVNTGPERVRTALAFAAEHDLAVLANRPLNAVGRAGMVRLADPPALAEGEPAPDLDAALGRVRELERQFADTLAGRVPTAEGAPPATEYFEWADRIAEIRRRASGTEQWAQIEGQVSYAVGQAVSALDAFFGGGTDEWAAWRGAYLPAMSDVLRAMHGVMVAEAREVSERVAAHLDPFVPASHRGAPLARKAIWVAAHTPGVTAVLNGMRAVEYVEDAVAVMAWPPLDEVEPVYEAMTALR